VTCQSCATALASADVHYGPDGSSLCQRCATRGEVARALGGQDPAQAERAFRRAHRRKHIYTGSAGTLFSLAVLGVLGSTGFLTASPRVTVMLVILLIAALGDLAYGLKGYFD